MKRVTINGWVRCGNRWLTRLLMCYADKPEENYEAFFYQNYWLAKVTPVYFGHPMEIQISHLGAGSYQEIDDDTYVIHTKRNPQDAFVSWYHMLLQSSVLRGNERTWKGYLSWLTTQPLHPFREYTEGWLAMEEKSPGGFLWTSHEYAKDNKAEELLRLMKGMDMQEDLQRAEFAASILNADANRPSVTPGTKRRGESVWKYYYDAQDVQFIEHEYGDLISKLGYSDKDWDILARKESQWPEF